MKIIKNLFKPGLMLIFILFLASCQNEAIESDAESETITKAKNWLKNSPDLPIVQNKFFRSDIDWDKSFTYNEKLYVPFLDSNLSVTKVENVDGLSKTSRSYLVFTKLEKDSYNLNLEIYFSNDFSNLEDVEILKLPYIKIDENNQLISNSSNSITSKSDQAPEPVCEEYGCYEISYDPNTGVTEKLYYTDSKFAVVIGIGKMKEVVVEEDLEEVLQLQRHRKLLMSLQVNLNVLMIY